MVSAAYQMVKGPEVTEIVVPYHVLEEGDTLEGICCRLKDEYGDKRDWREIAFMSARITTRKTAGYTSGKNQCAPACSGRNKIKKPPAKSADGMGMYEVTSIHTSLF